MKNLLVICFLSFTILSCNSNKEENTASGEKAKAEEVKIENVELANDKDPICGMSVKASCKDTAVYDGKVYGFCNEVCKEEFKKNPEEYLKK